MNPRDLSHGRALIAGSNSVEVMDVAEHLVAHGWPEPVVVKTPHIAVERLRSRTNPFTLAVLLINQSDPETSAAIDMCEHIGCPVIVINGDGSKKRAGQVVSLSRPFIDTDLDQALRALGLLTR